VTTIATDGRTMAADGQVQDHRGVIVNDRPKVFRLSDGRLAGGAGNTFDVRSWIEWLDSGKVDKCPIESEQFSGLIVGPSGVLWVDYKGREALTSVPCAVGSGQEIAIGAMEAGASPRKAVEIAISRDIYSGGTITEERL
jgi:hypothetical protein